MNKDAPNDASTPKKQSIARRIVKFLFVFAAFVVVALCVVLWAGNYYLQSNKTKILQDLPFLDNSSITFDNADFSIFWHFPHATVSLRNLIVSDSLSSQHQHLPLKVGLFEIELSLKNWREKKFWVESIALSDGEFTLYKDSLDYNNLNSLFKKQDLGQGEGIQIRSDDIDVSLSNMKFHLLDIPKKTSIRTQIRSLQSTLNIKKGDMSAAVEMDMDVEELAFNRARGIFLANSRLTGVFQADFRENIVLVQPFELGINDQHFLFSAEFNTTQTAPSQLILENHHTDYDKFLPLVPERIQKSLLAYKVTNPFYAKVKILSDFSPGDNPIVDVDLQMPCNDLTVKGMEFKNALLDARYINRIYQDERAISEDRKNIRFEVKEFEAQYRAFHIQTTDALILYSPKTGDYIEVEANVEGKASGISDWLENEQFFFDKGTFQLQARVHSYLNDMEHIIKESDANLVLKDLSVIYGPADVSFPFEELVLNKKAGDANFSIVSSTFNKNRKYQIAGDLNNFPALLIDLVQQRVSSNVQLTANRLGWTDFVDLFGVDGYLKSDLPKTDRQKKQTMKTTISGIESSFQPTLSIFVDTLSYYDRIYLENFQTGVHFEGKDVLVLQKTSFEYGKGKVNFEARLDIGKKSQTPFEFELHTQNINLQDLLPSFNYFNIKLLQNLDLHYENIDIDIKLKGVLDDVTGLIPNTAVGEFSFDNQFVKGTINVHPEMKADGKAVMRTRLDLEGNPYVFNDFFKNEQFFFERGKFRVQFDYEGEAISFEDLLNKALVSLVLEDSEIYYKTADIRFPLTHIFLDLKENKGNFRLFMRSDSLQQELQFKGNIDNISELVLGNTGKPFNTSADIYSPKLSWRNFQELFASSSSSSNNNFLVKTKNTPALSPSFLEPSSPLSSATEEEQKDLVLLPKENKTLNQAMKLAVRGILNTFNPELHVQVDTFVYSDKLLVRNLKTGIGLIDTSILELYNTGFSFLDGSMNLKGSVDLRNLEETPFTANFDTKGLDVAALLESLEYLSISALEEMETLTGRITLNLDLQGVIGGEKNGLILEKTNGVLDFNLHNVELKGLAAIDTIAAKLKKRKRFSTISFAPISNRITINGTEILIPLMEVQSNALNLFIEGRVHPPDNTNIWISVPLKNLRKPKKNVPIEKQGYHSTKNKVYLEFAPDKEGKYKMKLRLKKKKFYQKRGIPEQFKKDKREGKKIWKELRKEKKKQQKKNE